jgi:hypothetical protein
MLRAGQLITDPLDERPVEHHFGTDPLAFVAIGLARGDGQPTPWRAHIQADSGSPTRSWTARPLRASSSRARAAGSSK